MAGYTSSWSAINGDLINASLFLNEYGLVEAAFDSATGHKHDGSGANGSYIPLISEINNYTSATCNAANIELSVFDGVGAELQLRLLDGSLVPVTTNNVDLGSTLLRYKDIWAAGATTLNTLELASGSQVASILDEDLMGSDSDTALATQQSIKAYVDTASGAIKSIIQTADTYNAVELDNPNDRVIISTDVASVKTAQCHIDATAISPASNGGLTLGVAGSFEFGNIYAGGIRLAGANLVTSILDEDDLVSDSPTALATQQSIKAFVELNATIDGGTY